MSIERAARIKVGRSGSVRERDRSVADAVIDDVSATGCLVTGDFSIAIGTLLAIGLPGIGTHAARVMRTTEEGAGCAFLMPLSAADLDAVLAAQAAMPEPQAGAPKVNGFVQMKDSIRSAANAASGAAPDPAPRSFAKRLVGALGGRRAR